MISDLVQNNFALFWLLLFWVNALIIIYVLAHYVNSQNAQKTNANFVNIARKIRIFLTKSTIFHPFPHACHLP